MELQMNKTFNHVAIASCFILGITLAYADSDSSRGNMHDQMFQDMDTNSDGMVTRDESKAFGAKKFNEIDANGDGQITSEEMNAAHKKMMGGERKKMDGMDMDASGKTRPQKDSANPKSETRATGSSSNPCCWSPRD
jgi:hypothetical protein